MPVGMARKELCINDAFSLKGGGYLDASLGENIQESRCRGNGYSFDGSLYARVLLNGRLYFGDGYGLRKVDLSVGQGYGYLQTARRSKSLRDIDCVRLGVGNDDRFVPSWLGRGAAVADEELLPCQK